VKAGNSALITSRSLTAAAAAVKFAHQKAAVARFCSVTCRVLMQLRCNESLLNYRCCSGGRHGRWADAGAAKGANFITWQPVVVV